jgi:multiple sugar transport system substrate-binding protein
MRSSLNSPEEEKAMESRQLNRREFLRLAAVTATGALAAACVPAGPQAPAQAPAAPESAGAEPIAISYWTWFGEGSEEGQKAMLDAFAAAYPNIKLEYLGLPYSQFLDKVSISYAGGTPPDCLYMDNSQQGFFGQKKLVVDQSTYGERDADFNVEDINPKALDLFTYDGMVLGYPQPLTTGQLFYNEDLLEAAGLESPYDLYKRGEWTWEVLRDYAIALTKRDDAGRPEVLGFSQWALWFLAMWSNGGDHFDDFRRPTQALYSQPETVAALQFLADLIVKDQAAVESAGTQQALGMDPNGAFNAGKIAIHLSWGPGVGRFDLVNHGVAPFPKGPSEKSQFAADLTTEVIAIINKSQHVEEAWQFARWQQQEWQKTYVGNPADPRVPSRNEYQELANAALPEPASLWYELIDAAKLRPSSVDWPKMSTQFVTPALDELWAGRQDAETMATTLTQQINDFLAANPQ